MYHFTVSEIVIKNFFSDIQELQSVKISRYGHLSGGPIATDRFGKLPVRKALKLLQFSEENFHFELS